MNKPLNTCPVCSSDIIISRLSCKSCQTEMSGEFELPVDRWELDQELIDFIKVFIYSEGSIKQSEKLLNCSYPKIKNLLKKTKTALGVKEQKVEKEESVINMLEKGEIDVEGALKQLRSKK